jgi:hypothetical protein
VTRLSHIVHRLVGLVLVLLMLSCPSVAENVAPAHPSMVERIDWAAEYLHRAVTPAGRFVYRRDLYSEVENLHRYNFLRHAGTVYAMAEYHSLRGKYLDTAALMRAVDYLVECCVAPVCGQPNLLALWSLPELTGSRRPFRQAKLGGTGLALAALVQVEFLLPGTTEPRVLRQLAEFLLFMQKADGSFFAKFIPSQGGRDESWVSLYYPGEAALGLIMLYELDSDHRWLIAAMDGLRYLARVREGHQDVPADHWALLATARLFRQDPAVLQRASPAGIAWNQPQGASIKRALLAHVEVVVEKMLAEQVREDRLACRIGGFNPDGRVAPTATRLEGLLAAWSILPEGPLRQRVRQAVDAGSNFLTAAQVDAGPYRGAFTRYHPQCASPEPRADEIRIDYVQHALAAMLAYAALFGGNGKESF